MDVPALFTCCRRGPNCSQWAILRPAGKIAKCDDLLHLSVFSVYPPVCPSVQLCVCSFAWNNSAPIGPIFIKFGIGLLCENLSRKFEFLWNPTIITGYLRGELSTFFYNLLLNFLRMRNIPDTFL